MNPRSGPDACPGAVRVHPAADGGLARVRLPGGRLPRRALAALAAAAADLGDGRLDLTSRGNVQLRGLSPGAETELGTRLRAAGLLPSIAHERARNVVCSPLSGRSGGVVDIRGLISEFDAGLCADPALAGLSGRFLFAFDDGRGDVTALRPDLGAHALDADTFALVIAGSDSGVRVAFPDAVGLLLDVARGFLDVSGTAWRTADLDDPIAALTPFLPTTGTPTSFPAPPVPPVGPIQQRDGRTALAALVPLGRLEPAALTALLDTAADEIVITPWRTVVLPDLPGPASLGGGLITDPASAWRGVTACAGRPGCAKSLTDVRADAARSLTLAPLDLLPSPHDAAPPAPTPPAPTLPAPTLPAPAAPAARAAPAAPSAPGSPGSPASPSGVPCGAASDAPGSPPVHWVGCGRVCGRPAGPHVAVVATGDGYEVRAGDDVLARSRDLTATAAAVATTRRKM
ncbi:hypothetical protein [Actinomadura atramentaria]|uniref:hypothetical protein n=1 Tax=Actinomadura atramentaria TaxID=1990 RepID=UPI0003A9BE8F|nr:hypothetical protein [Actinomadura atramentaria]